MEVSTSGMEATKVLLVISWDVSVQRPCFHRYHIWLGHILRLGNINHNFMRHMFWTFIHSSWICQKRKLGGKSQGHLSSRLPHWPRCTAADNSPHMSPRSLEMFSQALPYTPLSPFLRALVLVAGTPHNRGSCWRCNLLLWPGQWRGCFSSPCPPLHREQPGTLGHSPSPILGGVDCSENSVGIWDDITPALYGYICHIAIYDPNFTPQYAASWFWAIFTKHLGNYLVICQHARHGAMLMGFHQQASTITRLIQDIQRNWVVTLPSGIPGWNSSRQIHQANESIIPTMPIHCSIMITERSHLRWEKRRWNPLKASRIILQSLRPVLLYNPIHFWPILSCT